MRSPLALLLCLVALGCTDFPDIAASGRDLGPAGTPPPLLPFDQLVAATAASSARDISPARLQARVAALNARAAILRQPLREAGDIDEMRARLAALR